MLIISHVKKRILFTKIGIEFFCSIIYIYILLCKYFKFASDETKQSKRFRILHRNDAVFEIIITIKNNYPFNFRRRREKDQRIEIYFLSIYHRRYGRARCSRGCCLASMCTGLRLSRSPSGLVNGWKSRVPSP